MSNPFRDRMLSVGYLKGGRSRDRVREYRDEADGHRVKETTDEAGNTVTQHATKDDRQDVTLRPHTVVYGSTDIGSPGVDSGA